MIYVMKFFKNKYLFGIVYAVLLIFFTAYTALDTFVITRVYSTETPLQSSSESVSSSSESDNSATGESPSQSTSVDSEETSSSTTEYQQVISTSEQYIDENISITLTQYRKNETEIYVADIQLSSPEYLKTALAQNAYGKNVTQTTSEMSIENNAILAVNGDNYGSQEKGYVLRNGVLYRDTPLNNRQDLVIWADGSFEVIEESEVSAQSLVEQGAQQIISFGPALIEEKQISVSTTDEVDKAKSSNPRTAIGIIDDLHYVLVVSDGRSTESEGLTLYQLAEFMQTLNVETAYNLDGGGSSTMYFNGEVINNPTSSGKSTKERSVSDIVYIGY